MAHGGDGVAAIGRVPPHPLDHRRQTGGGEEGPLQVGLGAERVARALGHHAGDVAGGDDLVVAPGDLDAPLHEGHEGPMGRGDEAGRGPDGVGVERVGGEPRDVGRQLVGDHVEQLGARHAGEHGADHRRVRAGAVDRDVEGGMEALEERRRRAQQLGLRDLLGEPLRPIGALGNGPEPGLVGHFVAAHLQPRRGQQIPQRSPRFGEGRRLLEEHGEHELLDTHRQFHLGELTVVGSAQSAHQDGVGGRDPGEGFEPDDRSPAAVGVGAERQRPGQGRGGDDPGHAAAVSRDPLVLERTGFDATADGRADAAGRATIPSSGAEPGEFLRPALCRPAPGVRGIGQCTDGPHGGAQAARVGAKPGAGRGLRSGARLKQFAAQGS